MLGVSYFDAAMGLVKESTVKQLQSAETWRAVATEFFGSFILLFVTGSAVSAIGLMAWNKEVRLC